MPYLTGSANNATALKTNVENAAIANGWTLSGGILSKGINNVRLTATDAYTLKIEGSNSATFASGNAPSFAQLKIASAYWPVTYHLSVRTNPEFVYCHVQYNTNEFRYLAFGDIQKYGTWTGGNWFSASYRSASWSNEPILSINSIMTSATSVMAPDTVGPRIASGLFAFAYDSGDYAYNKNSFIHCEIDSQTWIGNTAVYGGSSNQCVSASFPIAGLITNAVPAWNQQTLLLPYMLAKNRPSNKMSIIGELPHIRHAMLWNLNQGDIITLGPDQWIVFPWLKKDASNPYNYNSPQYGTSGVIGFALRYDP